MIVFPLDGSEKFHTLPAPKPILLVSFVNPFSVLLLLMLPYDVGDNGGHNCVSLLFQESHPVHQYFQTECPPALLLVPPVHLQPVVCMFQIIQLSSSWSQKEETFQKKKMGLGQQGIQNLLELLLLLSLLPQSED